MKKAGVNGGNRRRAGSPARGVHRGRISEISPVLLAIWSKVEVSNEIASENAGYFAVTIDFGAFWSQ